MRTVERGKAAAKKSPAQVAEKVARKAARKAAKATVSSHPSSPDVLSATPRMQGRPEWKWCRGPR